jgi:hypothetical protein
MLENQQRVLGARCKLQESQSLGPTGWLEADGNSTSLRGDRLFGITSERDPTILAVAAGCDPLKLAVVR